MTDGTDDNQFPGQPAEPPADPGSPREPEPPAPEPEVASESASEPAPEAAPPGPDPREQIKALKEKAAEAFKTGSSDAREAFDRNFPQAKEEITKGINDASYAFGYAVSFGTTLIKEFTPNNVSEGFERGSRAGTKAAEEVIEHRRTRSVETPDEPDPATS